MRCVICNEKMVATTNMYKKHLAKIHGRAVQFDRELRHYLYSLKVPVNKKDFVCLMCNRGFDNNREYYLHKFLVHRHGGQVGGGADDDLVANGDDVEIFQQNHMSMEGDDACGYSNWG